MDLWKAVTSNKFLLGLNVFMAVVDTWLWRDTGNGLWALCAGGAVFCVVIRTAILLGERADTKRANRVITS